MGFNGRFRNQIRGVNMNEIILIILMGLVLGFFLWREDKKKKEQELSDRLYNAENNITRLNNLNNRKRSLWHFQKHSFK